LAIGNKLQPFLQGAYDLAAGIAKQLSGIGQGAKKETVENIALKKTESDLAKKILDVSIQQGVWIERKRAASELLLELDTKITNQENQFPYRDYFTEEERDQVRNLKENHEPN
jgi:hypothetical protein